MRRRLQMSGLILLLCLSLSTIQAENNKLLIKFKDGSDFLIGIKSVKNFAFLGGLTILSLNDTAFVLKYVFSKQNMQGMYFQTVIDNVPTVNETANAFIYPNPTKGIIYFKGLSSEPVAIRLYNMSGVQVFSARVSSSVQSVNIDFLPRGIYLVNANGQLSKLIKL